MGEGVKTLCHRISKEGGGESLDGCIEGRCLG